ncbi:start-2 domain protein, partial [Cystoisospora suis]
FSRVSVPRPSPSSASAGLSSSKHNQKPQQTTLLSSCPPSVAGAPDTSSSSPPAAGAPQETVLPPSPSALALAEKHEEKKKDENLSDLPTKSEGGGEQGGEENKQKQAEDIPLLHDGASPSPSSGGAAAAVPSPHDHEKDSPLPNHVDDASPSSSCPQSPSPRGVIPLEGKVSHARPSSSSSPPSDDISPHEGENGARLSSDGKTQGEEEPSSSSPSLPALVITAKDQKDPHAPTDNPSHDKDDCSHTAGGAEKGKEERKKEDGDLPSSEDALKTKAEEASSPALIPLSPSTNGEKSSSSSSAAAAAGGEEEEKGMVNEMGGMTDDTMMDACTYGEYSRGLAGSRGGGPGHMVDGKMSLDEVLDRKWKKLSSYMHEEQLFKAYSYLLLLEHQVDHRLTVLTTTLASSPPPPPPTDGNSSSLSGGPSGKTPPHLSSLARSGSCASSQLSAFSSANLGGACQGKTPQGGGIGAGGIASSSSNHP